MCYTMADFAYEKFKDLIDLKDTKQVLCFPDNEPKEFTDSQIARLDDIENAAYAFLQALAETDDISYDMDSIWNVIYAGADALQKNYQRRVRIPTRVTDSDGRIFMTDWYGEAEEVLNADMDNP